MNNMILMMNLFQRAFMPIGIDLFGLKVFAEDKDSARSFFERIAEKSPFQGRINPAFFRMHL